MTQKCYAVHRVLVLFLVAVRCCAEAEPPPTRFEVNQLPGWTDQAGNPKPLFSRMFTGYIPAGTPPSGNGTMYFHYMMVMAEESPDSAPVVVWYNGGPGASSLFGIFQEFGPLLLTAESLDTDFLMSGVPTLIENPNRWSRTHTLVAIDSPPPMGLSFCSEHGPAGGPTSCGPWTDKTVFAANHVAHKTFFTDIFPGLKGNPIFFAGESYGGMYVPGFVEAILDDPVPGLNFQGMIIGDGFPGCPLVEGKPINWCINLQNVGMFKYPNANPGPYYDVEFFHGHQQYSNELYQEIKSTCSESMLRATNAEELDVACSQLIDRMAEEVGPYSAYNLYDNCPEDNPWTPSGPGPQLPAPSTGANGNTSADFAGDAYGMFSSIRARRAWARRLNHPMARGRKLAVNTDPTDLQDALTRLHASEAKVAALQKELKLRGTGRSGESGTSSPCLANAMPLWFAQNVSLTAFGAPPGIRFINLDNGIGFNYTTDQPFVGPIYQRMIKSNVRVLMIEGDTDACGLTTSPNEDAFFPLFSESLNVTRMWRPFASGTDSAPYLGGYITEWGRLDGNKAVPVPQVLFVSVRGAGHMVPLNRPRVAVKIVNTFTHHGIFPDYKPGAPPSTPDASVYV